MSTSLQDIIGQLQRSGILSDVQPGMDSGLFGKLAAPYGGAANLGLNLLANSGPSTTPHSFGQIVGQSALQAQQVAQQTQTNALQRQLMAMQIAQGAVGLGTTLQRQQAMQDLLGGGGATSGSPDSSPAPAPSVSPPQSPPAPSAGAPQSGLPSISQPQIQAATRLAMLNPNANPLDVLEKGQQAQIQARQRAVQPQISAYEDVAQADSPTREVRSNPQLQAAWTQMAPAHGIDPVKGFNDSGIRTVFGLAASSLRAANGLPPGKEPELQQVVGQGGAPQLVTKAQAIGKQPFNASIFGASNLSDDAVQLAADTYRTTGKMPAAFGRNPAMQAKVLDRVAQDAKANGDTAGAIAARSASLKANGMALDQITKLESATTSYANTLDKNLDSLLASAKKVDSTGSPLINRAFRAWQQGVTGDKDTAQMVTWLNAVQSEYAKINSGSLGNAPVSDASRKHADEVINKNFSAGGMAAVAQAMREEKGNRLSAIAEQKASLQQQLGAAPNAPSGSSASAGKGSVSADTLNAYAQKHGISPAQARRFLTSQGYQVP
jgi:hypothetical protein